MTLQPPLNIIATPTPTGISLSWQPNPANPAGVVYAIYRLPVTNAAAVAIIAQQINALTYTDSPTPGVQWTYLLHSQIADGTTSASAIPVTASYSALSAAPVVFYQPPAGSAYITDQWLASFPKDADGYTIFPTDNPVYIGSQPGDCTSFAAAQALCAKQGTRCILFRRGQTFDQSWIDDDIQIGGPSPSQPFVVGCTPDLNNPRPILTRGFGIDGSKYGVPAVKNLVIFGLDFYGNLRDPANPAFAPTSSNASWYQTFALRMIAGTAASPKGGDHLWIEDCRFRFFQMPVDLEGSFSTLITRRNIIDHNWAWHFGEYVSGITDVLIVENFFDHNGWNETAPGAGKTIFNHNAYLQIYTGAGDPQYRVINNIFARAACEGCQQRPGGLQDGNTYIGNPMAFFLESRDSIARNCVVTGAGFDLSAGPGNPRGDGFLSNFCTSILIENCIFTDKTDSINTDSAIVIQCIQDNTEANIPTQVTLQNVIVHNWTGPTFYIMGKPRPITFTNCDLPNFNAITPTPPGIIPTPKYVAPARTITKYAATLNLPTAAALLDAMSLQRRGNFNSNLTAPAVNQFFQSGFTVAA